MGVSHRTNEEDMKECIKKEGGSEPPNKYMNLRI